MLVIKNWQPFVFAPELHRFISFHSPYSLLTSPSHLLCHRADPRRIVLDIKVLIRKLIAPENRRTPRSIPIQEIPALDHEVVHHAVELGALVAEWFVTAAFGLTGAEFAEVIGGLGDDFGVELDFNPAERLAWEELEGWWEGGRGKRTAERDVEEAYGVVGAQGHYGCEVRR